MAVGGGGCNGGGCDGGVARKLTVPRSFLSWPAQTRDVDWSMRSDFCDS